MSRRATTYEHDPRLAERATTQQYSDPYRPLTDAAVHIRAELYFILGYAGYRIQPVHDDHMAQYSKVEIF